MTNFENVSLILKYRESQRNLTYSGISEEEYFLNINDDMNFRELKREIHTILGKNINGEIQLFYNGQKIENDDEQVNRKLRNQNLLIPLIPIMIEFEISNPVGDQIFLKPMSRLSRPNLPNNFLNHQNEYISNDDDSAITSVSNSSNSGKEASFDKIIKKSNKKRSRKSKYSSKYPRIRRYSNSNKSISQSDSNGEAEESIPNIMNKNSNYTKLPIVKKNIEGSIQYLEDKNYTKKTKFCSEEEEFSFLKKHKRSQICNYDDDKFDSNKRFRSYTDDIKGSNMKNHIFPASDELEEGEIEQDEVGDYKKFESIKEEGNLLFTKKYLRKSPNKSSMKSSKKTSKKSNSSFSKKLSDSFSESSFEKYVKQKKEMVKDDIIDNDYGVKSEPDKNSTLISKMNQLKNTLFDKLDNYSIEKERKVILNDSLINTFGDYSSEDKKIYIEKITDSISSKLSEINYNSISNNVIKIDNEKDIEKDKDEDRALPSSLANKNIINNLNDSLPSIKDASFIISNNKNLVQEEDLIEIIDINAVIFPNKMNVDDDSMKSIEKNSSSEFIKNENQILIDEDNSRTTLLPVIDLAKNSTLLDNSKLVKNLEDKTDTKYDVVMKNEIVNKNENYYDTLNFYPCYFNEDLNSTDPNIQEIDNLMKSIQINEETKLSIRKKIDSKIPKIKNRKEVTFNQAYLHFYLKSFPFNYIRNKLKNKEFKLNIVLDIDSTIIFAEQYSFNKLPENKQNEKDKEDSFLIKPVINNSIFTLRFKIRKFVPEMLQRISQYANLYIHTHGQEPYAKEVLRVIYEQTGIEIKAENICSLKSGSPAAPKTLRQLSDDKFFVKNALILDDNARAWEAEYYDNLIQSMKFHAFFGGPYFDEKQIKQLDGGKYIFNYLLTYNRAHECSEFNLKFTDENNAPLSLEYDFSKRFQITHIMELLENVYKLCILQKSKFNFNFSIRS